MDAPQNTRYRSKALLLIPLLLIASAFIPVETPGLAPISAGSAAAVDASSHVALSGNFQLYGFTAAANAEPPPHSASEPPLKLSFPTPEPAQTVLLRPPAYDVPWALNPNDHFFFIRPIPLEEVIWRIDDYRYGDIYENTDIIHTGLDIIADQGTPILAAAAGKVVWAGEGISRGVHGDVDPYGLAVAILHDFGVDQRQIQTVYGHMDRVDVTLGQRVEAGDQIGIVGTTGFTSGPHLHFEVRVEEDDFFATRNPELWIAPPQGWGVLAARLMKKDGTPFYNLEVSIRSLDGNHLWKIHTYSPSSVHSDDYFQENLVLSDLPAGDYQVSFRYFWNAQSTTVSIRPGAVTYFTFQNTIGFKIEPPQASETTSPFPGATEE